MICKTVELRDRGTFVPALAIKLTPTNEADRYLLSRAGYGLTPERQSTYVMLCGLDGGLERITCDPFDWGDNATRHFAHLWLIEHFDEIESGAVVDAEFIRGESKSPKVTEAIEHPGTKFLTASTADYTEP
jgi:hypothetical protein